MEAERVLCARCDKEKQLGHLDPDNLRWYCEDCWMEFSGKSRLCFRCRDFVPNGSVDARDKRWYCTKCWEFYTRAPAPRKRSRSRSARGGYRGRSPARRSPVRQYPTQRVFLTPNPAIAAGSPQVQQQPQYIQQQPQYIQQQPQYQIQAPQQQPQYAHAQQQPQYAHAQQQPQYQQQLQQAQPQMQVAQPTPQYMQQQMAQPQPQYMQQPQPQPQGYNIPQISMPDISYAPMNNGNNILQQNTPYMNSQIGGMDGMGRGLGMDMDLDMMVANMGMGLPMDINMPPNMGPNPFAPGNMMDPFGLKGKKGKKGAAGKEIFAKDGKGKKGIIIANGKLGKGKGARGGFYDQPAMSPSANSAGPDPSQRFQGVVKGYGQKGTFGFINCVETAALYGRDVFIHKTQMSEALGINLDEHPEMKGEDFEVAIEFGVTTNNEKGLPQARDCWLVEDEALRAKLMADAGIDPTKRSGLDNPQNFADALAEPQVQMRPPSPFKVPPPPPPVRTPDSSDSDKADSDNASKSSKADSNDKDDSDSDNEDSDKDDSDKEDSDKADHDDAKSDASDH